MLFQQLASTYYLLPIYDLLYFIEKSLAMKLVSFLISILPWCITECFLAVNKEPRETEQVSGTRKPGKQYCSGLWTGSWHTGAYPGERELIHTPGVTSFFPKVTVKIQYLYLYNLKTKMGRAQGKNTIFLKSHQY